VGQHRGSTTATGHPVGYEWARCLGCGCGRTPVLLAPPQYSPLQHGLLKEWNYKNSKSHMNYSVSAPSSDFKRLDDYSRQLCSKELSEKSRGCGRDTSHKLFDSKVEIVCQEELRRCLTNTIGQTCKVEFDKGEESREIDKCIGQLYQEELSDISECYGEVTCQGRLDSNVERIRQEEVKCQTNAVGQACKVEFDIGEESREIDKCIGQLYREELSDTSECCGEVTFQRRLDSKVERIL